MPHDRLTQLLKCRLIELAPRLKAVRPNVFDGDFGRYSLCRCACRSGRSRWGWDLRGRSSADCSGELSSPETECAEPTPEAACLSLLHAS